MVSIKSLLGLSYKTSIESDIVSLTIFEIFHIKVIFHWSNDDD